MPRGTGKAIFVLALLCLVNAFSYVDRSMLALVMPQLTKELALSDTVTGLIAGLPFALCYAICAIPIAWVGDNYNRRNLLAGALAFWSAVTALTGSVHSGWQLAAARFGLGAGEAAGHPTSASLIADSFDLKSRTVAFAALSASVSLGPLIGFPVVGWMLEHHGWRTAYHAVGLAGVVVAIVFFLVVREPPRSARPAAAPKVGFLDGAARLLKTRSYALVIFAGGFNAINQGALLTWGPTFLDRVQHLGPQETTLYFGTLRGIAGLIGALSAAVVVGLLVRRDIRWQIRAAIVVAVLPFLSDMTFLFGGRPLLWQTGLGLSAFFTQFVVAVSYPLYVNVAPNNLRATASAFYFLIASLMGFILGPGIVGFLNDQLAPSMGAGAIAYSMAAASSTALVSALLLILAKRTWVRDAERAEAN
ncbi:MAG: MFS transporter [Candidatus Andeanibacterium colombiense]|uniref:MFS transporter n=1 Tax=Candidatus Andeanibacterium colombiense TaxID=3121345 RepID=A0AAJ5X6G3_9SPHN|nr:MAG: MFS transporter [Sphingomonadaceae bacterium]